MLLIISKFYKCITKKIIRNISATKKRWLQPPDNYRERITSNIKAIHQLTFNVRRHKVLAKIKFKRKRMNKKLTHKKLTTIICIKHVIEVQQQQQQKESLK